MTTIMEKPHQSRKPPTRSSMLGHLLTISKDTNEATQTQTQLRRNRAELHRNRAETPKKPRHSKPIIDNRKHLSNITTTNMSTSTNARPTACGSSQAQPPADLICPLTGQLMTHPVVTRHGIHFERIAILSWLGAGHVHRPITLRSLRSCDLTFDEEHQARVQAWMSSHGHQLAAAAEEDTQTRTPECSNRILPGHHSAEQHQQQEQRGQPDGMMVFDPTPADASAPTHKHVAIDRSSSWTTPAAPSVLNSSQLEFRCSPSSVASRFVWQDRPLAFDGPKMTAGDLLDVLDDVDDILNM